MTQAPSPSPGMPIVTEDRPCPSCGYNLRGLHIGSRCPECGAAITGRKKASSAPEDTMGDAPAAYLNTLSMGFLCIAAATCIYLLTTVSLVMDFAAAARTAITGIASVSGMPSSLLTRYGGLVASLLWVVGSIIVILPRPAINGKPRTDKGKPEWYRLRLGVLITSSALGASNGLYSLSLILGWAVADWLGWLIGLTFFASVLPLCVHLSNLAYWSTDTELSDRLRSIGVLLGMTGILLAILFSPVGIIIGLFAGMIVLGCIIFLVWFVILMFKMMGMVNWAVQNAKQAEAREQRMAEKARREAEEAGFTPPAPVDEPDPAARQMLEDLDRRNREAEAQAHEPPPARPDQPGEPIEPTPRPGQQLGPGMDSTDADPYALEDD